jgi:hypothetical protein
MLGIEVTHILATNLALSRVHFARYLRASGERLRDLTSHPCVTDHIGHAPR